MLQTFDFSGPRQIDAKATFFKYEGTAAAGGSEVLRVRADGNDLGNFLPGDAIELASAVTRWELTPTTLTATGTVKLGAGRISSSRIAGNVSIVDNSKDLTAAGGQFFGTYARTAGVGVFAIVGIRAVTKKAIIRRLRLGCSSATLVTVFTCTGDPTTTPATLAGVGRNLIAGVGAASLCKGISGEAAAAAPTVGELPGVASFATLLLQASTMLDIELQRPIQLNPGMGLVIVPNIAAVTAYISAEFEEVA